MNILPNYQKTMLDNGIRIVSDYMPNIRSVSIGFWIDNGSRDDPELYSGIAHFLEHTNFKGTKKRSPIVIAREIESRGGSLNAYTAKEVTSYYARISDIHLKRSVDVLCDMLMNSIHDPEEVNRERNVIFEELKGVEDTPDDLVFEQFAELIYPNHPLGRSVLGTNESLERITSEAIVAHAKNTTVGSRIIVSAAGNIEHKKLVRMIEKRMKVEKGTPAERYSPPSIENKFHYTENEGNTQQAHIVWGCRSFPNSFPHKYEVIILMTLLGGGMSSRLFQKVRERAGISYNIFSLVESFQDTGIFGVYSANEPEQAKRVVKMIQKEVKELAQKPISIRELKHTRDQLIGSIMLGLESPHNRMNRLAKLELYYNRYFTLDEILTKINAITPEAIQNTARKLFEESAQFVNVLKPA